MTCCRPMPSVRRRWWSMPLLWSAATGLAMPPGALRLSNAGEVLGGGGAQLTPERQLRQMGCELIGSLDAPADGEIVLLAFSALPELGVTGLSIDLNLPTLVPLIFA